MRIKAGQIFIVALFFASMAAFAEGEKAASVFEPRHQGFSYTCPVYLYGTKSASGAQLAYQLGKASFRLDASFVSDKKDGKFSIYANPSIGAFYSEDWESKIRTYQGTSIGIQKGIWNSFEGLSYFCNILTGAEWFVFERKAIYFEIGSGMTLLAKEGAFDGGTIIGGGIKCFF
jgi:hypothetical protein